MVIILIIAHKAELTDTEAASLKQCYRILGNYHIKLICPTGLDTSVYHAINPKADVVFIDPKWQSTYKMFNELKKDRLLYDMFREYRYLLFYELDAWIFSDQLEYWCNTGYDYVGAPWFKGWHNAIPSMEIIGVGNGGLSLRNIKTHLRILKRISILKRIRTFWFRSKLQLIIGFGIVLRLPFWSFKSQQPMQLNQLFSPPDCNEDYFWCFHVGRIFKDYRLASVKDAIRFSFEVNPSYLYELNNSELPFGCHAWKKYEPEFWRRFIPIPPEARQDLKAQPIKKT